MTIRVRAVFDGEVLRPVQPVPLRVAATYALVIEDEDEDEPRAEEFGGDHPLTEIGRLAVDMGVADLAEGHDRYAHGRLPGSRRGV